jgi:Mrp family chromosome partitioning ATPase/capsular polysaccharide biosynthesis protein
MQAAPHGIVEPMVNDSPSSSADAAWLRSTDEDNDLRRYASVLWLHRWLIIICVLLGMLAAIVYIATATPEYTAEADMFISPVSSANTATVSLGLITESGNPTGDVETAARLISTIDAARAVKIALGLRDSPQQILQKVSAQPVAQSNIVALSATASSPRNAAKLSNTFARTVIAQRTAQFKALLSREIRGLQSQLTGIAPSSAEGGVLSSQLAQIRALLASPLPDMRISSLAVPPSGRSSPRYTITIIGGIIGGLVLGVAIAFMLEYVDVRVQREQQLRSLFRLPVLAVVPREGGGPGAVERFLARLPVVGHLVQRRRVRRSVPRAPRSLSPAALEAYRTLRATLLASGPQFSASRSILVTGASASEGKTTTAINLAFSLAASGRKVILLEADLHRPSIGKAVRLRPRHDVSSVLTGDVPISDALVDDPNMPALRYLLAVSEPEPDVLMADALLLPTAALLLSEALQLADFVIVDAPPLAEVIDALELAALVDDVLVVVRLGQTRVPRLRRLGELLARSNIKPVGIAVIGAEPPKGLGAYGYGYAAYAPRARAEKSHSDVS